MRFDPPTSQALREFDGRCLQDSGCSGSMIWHDM